MFHWGWSLLVCDGFVVLILSQCRWLAAIVETLPILRQFYSWRPRQHFHHATVCCRCRGIVAFVWLAGVRFGMRTQRKVPDLYDLCFIATYSQAWLWQAFSFSLKVMFCRHSLVSTVNVILSVKSRSMSHICKIEICEPRLYNRDVWATSVKSRYVSHIGKIEICKPHLVHLWNAYTFVLLTEIFMTMSIVMRNKNGEKISACLKLVLMQKKSVMPLSAFTLHLEFWQRFMKILI